MERRLKAAKRDFGSLGGLWLGYGSLRILEVAAIVAFSSSLRLMWGALLERVPNPVPWMTAFDVAMVLIVAWAVVSAFFAFVAGVTLRREPASRTDGIIAALLALPDLPFGIVLGAFTLVALTRSSAVPQSSKPQSHIVIPLVPQRSR